MYPRAYHGFYRVTNARVTKQAEHDNREALRGFLTDRTPQRFRQASRPQPQQIENLLGSLCVAISLRR